MAERRQSGGHSRTLAAAARRHGCVKQQDGSYQLRGIVLITTVEHRLPGVHAARQGPAFPKPRVDHDIKAVVDLSLLSEVGGGRHQVADLAELRGLDVV